MGRMDKYEEPKEEVNYSRVNKNQDMYKEIYMNNTMIDLNNILVDAIKEEERVEEESRVIAPYVPKNYDVNDYIKEARENRVSDNIPRSLDNTDCEVSKVKEKKDEISRLIESIEAKEKEGDFFMDLMPEDGEDTVVTEPVDDEDIFTSEEDITYEMDKTIEDTTNSFKAVISKKEQDDDKNTKRDRLPLIVCISSFIVLVIVIIIIAII